MFQKGSLMNVAGLKLKTLTVKILLYDGYLIGIYDSGMFFFLQATYMRITKK